MKRIEKKIIVIFLLGLFLTQGRFVFSQGVAKRFKVIGENVEAGDIVSQTEDGVSLTKIPYDKNMIGVIGSNPVLIFGKPSSTSLPVVSFGEELVKVSDVNGEIRRGDFITSSKEPGIGQKATEDGYVLGIALEDLKGKEGLIRVNISIGYHYLRLKGKPVLPILQKIWEEIGRPENFPEVLKYIFAVILAAGSFFFGFLLFGRTLQKGIESIGRNPLAKGSIHLAMIMNLIAIVFIALTGLFFAVFVIIY